MFNLHYDISSAFIFAVIIISMTSRHVLKNSTSRFFFTNVFTALGATVADIISELSFMPVTVRTIADYFYYLFAITVPCVYILYVYSTIGLFRYFKEKPIRIVCLFTPLALATGFLFSNIFTKSVFYINSDGRFVRGPFQPVIIGCCILYLMIGTIIIIKWHSVIPTERFWPLLSLFPIMLLVLTIQQIFQGLEITTFGLAIVYLIISFTIRRSDENYDEFLGIKNENSAEEVYKKIFATKQNVRLIYIKVMNQPKLRNFLGLNAYNQYLKELINKIDSALHEFHIENEIYYLHHSTYGVHIDSSDTEFCKKIADAIYDSLKNSVELNDVSISLDLRSCLVRIPEDFNNIESLVNFRMNFHNRLPEADHTLMVSDFIESKDFKIKNDLDTIINNAIANHNFQMYYQPIYSTKEKKFTSAEALIRLIDPDYGFVSPAIFIPAAEVSGTIHQIGDYVIENVCHFISDCNFNELGLRYIELNLSISQCIEGDLAEKISELTKKYNVNPNQINLEITETAPNFDPTVVDRNIRVLYDKGFKFSLDDYGTGYSNTKRLTELPLDIVKLDKSFVDEMKNPQMWSVIVNTVRMFKEMNKIILVEGIEDEEALKTFTDLGCDYIQGYYFSKPLPQAEFIKFIKERNK